MSMKKTPILNPLAQRFSYSKKVSLSAVQFQRKGLVSIILTALFLLPFGNAGMGFAQTNKREALALDTSECLIITGSFDGTVKDFEGIYTAKLLKDNKIGR